MTVAHDRHVAARFDACASRFRASTAGDDYRLLGLLSALGPVRGLRILDLGCGKGRFARHLAGRGASVVGVDSSRRMLEPAWGLDRARGAAARLPFASGSFDAVVAVEVFEHLAPSGLGRTLSEIRRVLRPGGRVAIIDKNLLALDRLRPWLPKLAVKRIDEWRGRWMYPSGGPVRERWFLPATLARRLGRDFTDVRTTFLLSPEEARRAVFRRLPASRLMALWTARAAGGGEP